MLVRTRPGGMLTIVVAVFLALFTAGMAMLVAGSSVIALLSAPIAMVLCVGFLQYL